MLITASIISLAANWNSRDEGWTIQRRQIAEAALVFCDGKLDQPAWERQDLLDKLIVGDPNQPKAQTLDPRSRLRNQAKWFYEARRFQSCSDLQETVKDLENANTEMVNLIHIPAFGVSFDINDLGILSGVTFMVILIWLRVSLESELHSMRLTFAWAKRESVEKATAPKESSGLAAAYQLLGTHQFLTPGGIPGRSSSKFEPNRLFVYILIVLSAVFLLLVMLDFWGDWLARQNWNHFKVVWQQLKVVTAVKVLVDVFIALSAIYFWKATRRHSEIPHWQRLSLGLYWLPVIVLSAICGDQLTSLPYGLSISTVATISAVGITTLMLAGTCLLALDCIRMAQKVGLEWTRWGNRSKAKGAGV